MWHRSTDQAEAVAPPAQLGFDAAPPAARSRRSRVTFLITGLVFLLVITLLAVLLVSKSDKPKPAAATNAVEDVRQAFLNYYAAVVLEARQLDLAPVRPFLTNAGANQEQAILAQLVKTGNRFQITADHDLQIVVYSQGDLASVDDLFVRQTLVLDSKTQTPTGPEQTDTVHESYSLMKQGPRWLVDSVIEFGTAETEGNGPISYAAVSPPNTFPSSLRNEVDRAFTGYWAATKMALATLDPGPLDRVEIEPELGKGRADVALWGQRNLGYDLRVEHNYRLGRQNNSTIWIYDTYADTSSPFDKTTKKPVQQTGTEIIRKSFELNKVGDTWKVSLDTVYR